MRMAREQMETLAAAEAEAARRAAAGAAMRERAAREEQATAVNSRKLNADWLQRMRAAKLEELHAEAGALSREHDAQVDRYDRMIEASVEVMRSWGWDRAMPLWRAVVTSYKALGQGPGLGGARPVHPPEALVSGHACRTQHPPENRLACHSPTLPTGRPCWRTLRRRTRSTTWPLLRTLRCWTSCWRCTASGWVLCTRASATNLASCRRSMRGAPFTVGPPLLLGGGAGSTCSKVVVVCEQVIVCNALGGFTRFGRKAAAAPHLFPTARRPRQWRCTTGARRSWPTCRRRLPLHTLRRGRKRLPRTG